MSILEIIGALTLCFPLLYAVILVTEAAVYASVSLFMLLQGGVELRPLHRLIYGAFRYWFYEFGSRAIGFATTVTAMEMNGWEYRPPFRLKRNKREANCK